MSKQRDPKIILFEILDASRNIIEFKKAHSQESFEINLLLTSAVNYNLMIIGEATKLLPVTFRNKYEEVSWKKMAGLRDILIHQYHSTDSKNIWKIINTDIPTLIEKIEKILSSLEAK